MKKHRNKYPLTKVCIVCGSSFTVRTGAEFRNVTCSKVCGDRKAGKSRTGDGHPRWKGGRRIDRGYAYVYAPDHPNRTKAGYVLEHRLVMEKKLGRFLLRKEVVHHKNGVKLDNRIRNLELLGSNSEHAKIHAPESAERMRRNMTGLVPWNKGKSLPPPHNYSGLLIKCLNCGKEKHYPPSTVKKGKGKFCSAGCAFDYRYKRSNSG